MFIVVQGCFVGRCILLEASAKLNDDPASLATLFQNTELGAKLRMLCLRTSSALCLLLTQEGQPLRPGQDGHWGLPW